jgi:exopolysaccharide production protein ExoZ
MNRASISARARDLFEVSRNQRSTILSMEGLRGFAVLLVFFAHYVTQVAPWMQEGSVTARIAEHIRSLGHMGVDLFFVLSGYLLYGALIRRQRSITDFLAKRAARIYPTFLFVFGLYVVLSYTFPAESKLPTSSLATFIYLAQNLLFLPGMVKIEPLIVVSWSLSYEFFYYLAMPLFISALSLRNWAPARRLWLFAAISVIGFGYYFFTTGHIRLLMFVGGILLYEIQSQKRLRVPRWSGTVALVIAVVALAVFKHAQMAGWFRYTTLFVCLSWLCLECFTVSGGTERVFSLTPLRWLGNASYSYYLIHGLALKAFFFAFAKVHSPSGNEDLLFWALIPAVFAVTVVVSVVLYLGVERPLSLQTAGTTGVETVEPASPHSSWAAKISPFNALRPALVQAVRLWHNQRTLAAMKLLRQIAALLIPLGMGLSAWVVMII